MMPTRSSAAALDRWQPLAGAAMARSASGALDITTPATPWAYALLVPLPGTPAPADAVGYRLVLDLEVLSGSVGLFLTDDVAQVPISQETVVAAGGRTTVTVEVAGTRVSQLCIRSAGDGAARLRVYGADGDVRRRFDISADIDALMPVMLRSPGATALAAVADALSARLQRPVSPHQIGQLTCSRTSVPVPLAQVLAGDLGARVMADLPPLIDLLRTYDPSAMDARAGYLGPDYFRTFFRQSTIRVYHLVDLLRELGVTGGSVLEVGSLCGQFALALAHLGFRVTVVDRYRDYGSAYAGYTAHLRAAGVEVIETGADDEVAAIAGLGQFDTVMCMAVIEHIPHTPREFLRSLAAHTRPGGVLALDSPNLARYWNRRRLADGLSIHQAVADQFYGAIPWGGHHREYTADEMAWMLEQVGAREVRTRRFDYNLLQFEQLSASHLEALLAIVVDPSMADTTLVAGRLPA
jgi:2-polyprenyl-3-methyl-5-hydroxy-6-metoxy-1,4-benzoquinol methylase